jgi:hypothetical protein
MGNQNTVRIAAGSAIVVAGASLLLTLSVASPKFNPRPHLALGRMAAEQALHLAGNNGQIVLVDRDTSVFPSPATEQHQRAFFQTLKAGGRNVARTNLFIVNPISVITVPPGDFVEVLRKCSDSDVVVSFLGVVTPTDAQLTRLGAKRPHVLAFCPGPVPRRAPLKRLFEQKLLEVAIVSRPNPLPRPVGGTLGRQWFDCDYQLITAANLEDLPFTPEPRP